MVRDVSRFALGVTEGSATMIREAIQLLSSTQIVERTVHTHTGWRRLDGGWAYLHGGGALGASGVVAGVETSLPAVLAPFLLPTPPTGAELTSAVRASLAVLDLAPARVTVPMLGAVWRSILGAVDFSVFVYGATGRFKTAPAALLQQHFGAGFAADRLPGSWASTANFNESLAFIAKDTLLVIDDFRPGVAERRRLEGEADRLLRAAANGAGRGRLKSERSRRPAHPPRALIVSTGEAKPSGESLIARMFLVDVAPGDIDPKRLSACQRDAASGVICAGDGRIHRVARAQLDEVRADLKVAHVKYREQAAHEGLHCRTPGIVGDLFSGFERFLSFAHEAEALTRSEAEGYRRTRDVAATDVELVTVHPPLRNVCHGLTLFGSVATSFSFPLGVPLISIRIMRAGFDRRRPRAHSALYPSFCCLRPCLDRWREPQQQTDGQQH